MKAIWKIAKAELKYLFYSPVAWLILVIFAVQAGLAYTNVFDGFIRNKLLGSVSYTHLHYQTQPRFLFRVHRHRFSRSCLSLIHI